MNDSELNESMAGVFSKLDKLSETLDSANQQLEEVRNGAEIQKQRIRNITAEQVRLSLQSSLV